MALKVKITTENDVVKVIKDDFLVYAETICYRRDIKSPLRSLYDHLGIDFGETIEVEVQPNDTMDTLIYWNNELYYKESVAHVKLCGLDDCLFIRVFWLMFQEKFETSEVNRIDFLQSEVLEIKEKLNSIELALNPQLKEEE